MYPCSLDYFVYGISILNILMQLGTFMFLKKKHFGQDFFSLLGNIDYVMQTSDIKAELNAFYF